MKTETLPADHPFAIPHALDVLRNHGLVAFPTDTVYGLGALAFDPLAVERIYAVKGRSHTKAIAILLHDARQLPEVASDVGEGAMRLAERFWPGPLTLVMPRHPNVPQAVSRLPTIGVRVPNHPVALKLLANAGPMAVTSANRSGAENPLTARDVLAQLGGHIHLILDGGHAPGGIPSTVVDCTGPQPVVLREGPISLDEITKELGKIED